MTDEQIMELFRKKSTKAISYTHIKHQNVCMIIANNILFSEPLAKECLMKAYSELFEVLPTYTFNNLTGILYRTVRKYAVECYFEQKNGEMGEYIYFKPLYELKTVISKKNEGINPEVNRPENSHNENILVSPEDEAELFDSFSSEYDTYISENIIFYKEKASCSEDKIIKSLNHFITGLSNDFRKLFILRYFYMCNVPDSEFDVEFSKPSMQRRLKRMLRKLKKHFDKDNIHIYDETYLFELIGKLNDRLISEVWS